MKSCLGLLFSMLVLAAVIGTAVFIWQQSYTSSFTRKPAAVAQP